jgi:outer membrane murein-binding lipoprotein Lpp
MRPLFIQFSCFVALLFIAGCTGTTAENKPDDIASDSTNVNAKISKVDLFKDEEERLRAKRSLVFKPILDSAGRADKPQLLAKLKETYHPVMSNSMELTTCSYHFLYGSPDSIWQVALKATEENLCNPFGVHRQFIFDATGHLIYEDSAARFEFVKVWEDKPALLMTLNSDCKGSGQHHFYKYQSGQLIDIFNVLLETTPLTYDAQKADDYAVLEPALLPLRIEDRNKDGHNDLLFSGQRLLLKSPDNKEYTTQNPYRREKVEYVFLYEPGEDWFVLN